MRRPNLFVVGAMKSGTTSLHRYLDSHPEIFMTQDPWKETQYFVKERNWPRGEAWYLKLFDDAGEATILGETSTDYTKLPHYSGVVDRIAEFNPDARIIYIMRDPVERAISHYWWEVQFSGEGRDMLTAVRKVSWITDVSYYAMQLGPYLDRFGPARVLTLTAEQLSTAPAETLQKVFAWLGVDASVLPDRLDRRDNASGKEVNRLIGSGVLSHLRGGRVWDTLKRLTPPRLRQQALRTLSRPVARDTSQLAAAVDYLRPIQQRQTAELCELLGREFPEWTTLYGTRELVT